MEESSTIRCPKGSYMSEREHSALSTQLHGWRADRLAEGWSPSAWAAPNAREFETTGVSTYCSANSVHPATCRTDVWASNGDSIPTKRLPSGVIGYPLRSVHGGAVEFIHNYKVAGSSLMR